MEEVDRTAFVKWLLTEKTGKQSCMIARSFGEKIIQYLRLKRERGEDDAELKSKYDPTFRLGIKKRNFKLLNAVGLGDILCLPIKKIGKKSKDSHAMLGQNRQVIFKEDIYDVILNCHKNGEKHRGYKGTFNKINETYCSIPREVVHKFVEMCDYCAVNHACFTPNHHKNQSDKKNKLAKSGKAKRKYEFNDAFLTRCQVDIIDMTENPDGLFKYIGHFFDHHTKYNILFPLKTNEAKYVARKLCRHVLGHFGLPRIMYSNYDRRYLNELISSILQLWSSDAQIISGDPKSKKVQPFLHQRQRTVMILIETIRMKQSSTNNWALWLPGIQYSLNTNEFETDSPPSYDTVFKSRPRCYNYTSTSKGIVHEEDLTQSDDGREDIADDIVITEHQATEMQAEGQNETISSDFSPVVENLISPLSMASSKADIIMPSNTSVMQTTMPYPDI
eukprot:gene3647-4164_t